jgi:TPR repeat protein
MPRALPYLIAGLLTLFAADHTAVARFAPGHASTASADGVVTTPVRLAQRWTPLTGPLTPDGSRREPEKSSEPAPAPAPPPPADTGPVPEGRKMTLKATLGSATGSDGLTYGLLGLKSMSIDHDLAQGLGLGDTHGALITELVRDSAAETAHMRVADIVLRVDAREVATHEDLMRIVRSYRPGTEIAVDIWRVGEGVDDFKRFLQSRADQGDVNATVGLARLLFLGLALAKDDREAARLSRKAAEAGHVGAMTNLGVLLKDGIGVEKNEAESASWFLKAAEAGNETAMTNLAAMYEAGRGATQSDSEAARWYRKAADAGNAFAMHRLGLMHEAGRGVDKDATEAAHWFRLASDKGNSEASSKLAAMYSQGEGVAKDADEASRLNQRATEQVRRAAEQGQAVSMFNLGILYRVGKGVAKDDDEAKKWVIASFKRGDAYLVNELIRNPNILVLPDRKWVQTLLRDEGTYSGPIDGKFSPAVREAMEGLAGKR